jgi:hypothetical protein
MIIRPPIILDPTLRGNAIHKLVIRIKPGIPNFEAIVAQEVVEWRFLRFWGLLTMLPAIALFWFIPWPLVLPVLVLGHFLPSWIPAVQRKMELIGHSVEIEVAVRMYMQERAPYRWLEARALAERYSQFKGYTVERCDALLIEHEAQATKWVNRHGKWLRGRM